MNTNEVEVDSKAFANLFKEKRKLKDVSQRYISEKLHMSNSTLARWEKGNITDYNLSYLYRVSKFLDLNFFKVMVTLLPTLKKDYKLEVEMINILSSMSLKDRENILEIAKAIELYHKD